MTEQSPLEAQRMPWSILPSHAESELSEADRRYQALVAGAHEAILVFSAERLVLLNAAALRLFGVAQPDATLPRTSSELLPAECRDLVERVGPARAVEAVISNVQCQAVDVEVSAARVDYAATRAVQYVLRDISERKRRDAELRRMIRAERARSQINQALLRASDEAGFLEAACRVMVETCGHALMWIGIREPDAGALLRPIAQAGFGRDDPCGFSLLDARRGNSLVSGMDDAHGMPADDAWRNEALRRGYLASVELPLRDARGEAFGAITLYSQDQQAFLPDKVVMMRALADDLAFGIHSLRLRTAHAETEAAMVALRNEFQQLLEWQVASQTASAIAHEIGQPLNAVTTFGEAALLLLDTLSPRPDRLAWAVQGMAAQAERAGHVVRELMQFLRQGEVTLEDLDLDVLLRGAIAMARASFLGVGRISLGDMPKGLRVRGNRLQIDKVLMNLIGNGMDAMRDAGLTGKEADMTLSVTVDAERVRVTLRDKGPGLDPAIAPRIFEPFFTTKAKGIGMGLSISRALIEAQGGKLWYESPGAAGAVFHFTIPLAS